MNSKIYDLIIVGGGAAGMFGGIVATGNGKNVAIIEKNEALGKKILATGNGKCNFTNTKWKEDSFRGDFDFAYKVYDKFDYKKTLEFFEEIGIYHYERDGYCYPYSRQAKAVCDCLLHKLYKLGVEIFSETSVVKIKKKEVFEIEAIKDGKVQIFHSKKVLITTGGKSYSCLGSDGSGYTLAKALGHKITPVYPALVKLYVKENVKALDGVRAIAKLSLIIENKKYETKGEIIFGKNSVSGIPIFEISRYCAEAIAGGKETDISIDFFPDIDREKLQEIIKRRSENISSKTYRLLIGLINDKLASYYSNLGANGEDGLVESLKNMRLSVTKAGEFDIAQVTAGGVDTKEIDCENMESLLVDGLYFAGEVVNVDGNCGGYNLQWAWSSAYVAAKSI